MSTDNLTYYRNTAEAFVRRIEYSFTSEDTLKALWEDHFGVLPFDRTDKWNLILRRELQECWESYGPPVKASMTQYDIDQVVRQLLSNLDYNLFTQVMLNLQSLALLRYRIGDAEAEVTAITERWEKAASSPAAPKAKMVKNASTEEETAFNRDLSSLKALRIISKFEPTASFRVSPKGSTPALVDSCNLSSLGFGADKYLQLPDGYQAFYLNIDGCPLEMEPQPDGSLRTVDIDDYTFVSKSGGEILAQSLWARQVARCAYDAAFLGLEGCRIPGTFLILPRLTSVMVIAPAKLHSYLAASFQNASDGVTITVGPR